MFRKVVGDLLREAADAVVGHKFGQHFLFTEWEQVVDAWQLAEWEAYRDVARLGRKTRLPEAQRKVLWFDLRARSSWAASAPADHLLRINGGCDAEIQEGPVRAWRAWGDRAMPTARLGRSSKPERWILG